MPSTRAVRSLAILTVFLAGVASAESPTKLVEAKARFHFDMSFGGGVAYSPDGATLAAGYDDGTIHLLSAVDGKPGKPAVIGVADKQFASPWATPGPIRFSPDGSILVAGNFLWKIALRDERRGSDALRAWDVTSGRVLYTIPLVGDARTFVVTADGRTLRASVRVDKDRDVVHSWDLKTGSPGETITLPSKGTSFTAFSRAGTMIASARPDDPAITVHYMPSGRARSTLSSSMKRGPSRMVFSPDGRILAAVREGNIVELWDLDSRKIRASIAEPSGECSIEFEMAFSPDSRRLILSGAYDSAPFAFNGCEGRFILIDALKGTKSSFIQGFGLGIQCNDLTFSLDGRSLARSSIDFFRGVDGHSGLTVWELPPGP